MAGLRRDPNIRVATLADDPAFLIPQKPKVRGRAYYQEMARPSILGWNVLRHAKLTIDYVNRGVELCFE